MKRVIALGFFDGVHLGHRALLRKARQEADRLGCMACAVTFDRHPADVIFGRTTPLLQTLPQREQLMKTLGMDEVLTLPFDENMMHMPWQEFAAMLRQRHHAAAVVCGYDFTFGFRGEGNAQRLQEVFGECCHVIGAVEVSGQRVSSSAIRAFLQQGQVALANRMLGSCHTIEGKVIPGKQLGRRLGIPTANIRLPEGTVVPAFGVYAARVDGHLAVTNIGTRPSVDDGEHITVESWLLNFEGDLYGKTICVELLEFLRPEQKFSSVEELKAQILRDAEQVKQTC
ncbi:MAG: riboflavin biosynthesis protein RibF [Oscillospiraceae bacterium]|nr:riboflavin biosynthesis protein RibF [Oscillospiraceae bacterium]